MAEDAPSPVLVASGAATGCGRWLTLNPVVVHRVAPDDMRKGGRPSGALCRPRIFRRCSHFASWPGVSRRESLAIANSVVEHIVEIQSPHGGERGESGRL
jgi:hypothetical protein